MASVLRDAEVVQTCEINTPDFAIEASIISELREEALSITTDWAHALHTRATAFSSITQPLHKEAYSLLSLITAQPLNLAIRARLATLDFQLAKLYRPGTYTPSQYDSLPLALKTLFHQLRRVSVESAYLDWCLRTRDQYEHVHFSKKLREVVAEKEELVAEHLRLLGERERDGVLDEGGDARILEIQEHIFAGDYFTERDREEHMVQMEMIAARQKTDREIREYVQALLEVERYEEAQWAGEFFDAVEKQRMALDEVAQQQKEQEEEEEESRREALLKYIWQEFERRKSERLSKVTVSKQGTEETLPKAAAPSFGQTEHINKHAAATPEGPGVQNYCMPGTQTTLPPGYDPTTGRIALPANYRPPMWATLEAYDNPEAFNRQIFEIECAALMDSQGLPRIGKMEVFEVYNQIVANGEGAIHVLDLIERRRQRDESATPQNHPGSLNEASQRVQRSEFQKIQTNEFQAVVPYQGHPQGQANDVVAIQQANAERFKAFVQEQILESTIEHYYRHFLSKTYVRINPDTHMPVVNRAQYGILYRQELAEMTQHAVNEGVKLRSEDDRQEMYKHYCSLENIKKVWRITAQTLNGYEKVKARTAFNQERWRVQDNEAVLRARASGMQMSVVPIGHDPTAMDNSMDRRSSTSSAPDDLSFQSQFDHTPRRPSGQLADPIKPNQLDRGRLLEALQVKTIVRGASGEIAPPQTSRAPLFRNASSIEGEKMWLGNVFGWRSVRDPAPMGMTMHEYGHWVNVYRKNKELGAKMMGASPSPQRPMRQQGAPAAPQNNPNAAAAALANSPNSPAAIRGGMAAHAGMQTALMKTLDTRFNGNASQQAKIAHAQARMPVGNILQQKQRAPLHAHRGPAPGSHVAHAGFGAQRAVTPSKLGQYALTAENGENQHSEVVAAQKDVNAGALNSAKLPPGRGNVSVAASVAPSGLTPTAGAETSSSAVQPTLIEPTKQTKKETAPSATVVSKPATQKASVPSPKTGRKADKDTTKTPKKVTGSVSLDTTVAASSPSISNVLASPSVPESPNAALRVSQMLKTLKDSPKNGGKRKDIALKERADNSATAASTPKKRVPSQKAVEQPTTPKQEKARKPKGSRGTPAGTPGSVPKREKGGKRGGQTVQDSISATAINPSSRLQSDSPLFEYAGVMPKTPKIRLPSSTVASIAAAVSANQGTGTTPSKSVGSAKKDKADVPATVPKVGGKADMVAMFDSSPAAGKQPNIQTESSAPKTPYHRVGGVADNVTAAKSSSLAEKRPTNPATSSALKTESAVPKTAENRIGGGPASVTGTRSSPVVAKQAPKLASSPAAKPETPVPKMLNHRGRAMVAKVTIPKSSPAVAKQPPTQAPSPAAKPETSVPKTPINRSNAGQDAMSSGGTNSLRRLGGSAAESPGFPTKSPLSPLAPEFHPSAKPKIPTPSPLSTSFPSSGRVAFQQQGNGCGGFQRFNTNPNAAYERRTFYTGPVPGTPFNTPTKPMGTQNFNGQRSGNGQPVVYGPPPPPGFYAARQGNGNPPGQNANRPSTQPPMGQSASNQGVRGNTVIRISSVIGPLSPLTGSNGGNEIRVSSMEEAMAIMNRTVARELLSEKLSRPNPNAPAFQPGDKAKPSTSSGTQAQAQLTPKRERLINDTLNMMYPLKAGKYDAMTFEERHELPAPLRERVMNSAKPVHLGKLAPGQSMEEFLGLAASKWGPPRQVSQPPMPSGAATKPSGSRARKLHAAKHDAPSTPRRMDSGSFMFSSSPLRNGENSSPHSPAKEKLMEFFRLSAHQAATAKASGSGSGLRYSQQKLSPTESPSAPPRVSTHSHLSHQEQAEKAFLQLAENDVLAKKQAQEERLRTKHVLRASDMTFSPAIDNPDVPALDFAEQARYVMESLSISTTKSPARRSKKVHPPGRRQPPLAVRRVTESDVAMWETADGQAMAGSLDALDGSETHDSDGIPSSQSSVNLGCASTKRPFQFQNESTHKHSLVKDGKAESPLKRKKISTAMGPTSAPANASAAASASVKTKVSMPPGPAPTPAIPPVPKSALQQTSEAIQKRLQELEAQVKKTSSKSSRKPLQESEFLQPGETLGQGPRKAAKNGAPKFMTKEEWEAVAEKAKLRKGSEK